MYAGFEPNRPMNRLPISRKLPGMVGRRPKISDAPHRLRALRLAKPGITLDQIAEKLCTNAQTVQRVELGKIELKVSDLARYAEALGVEPAEIIGVDKLFTDARKTQLLSAFSRMPSPDQDKLVRMVEAMAPAAAPAIDITAVERGVEDELAARGVSYTQDEKDELLAQAAQHLLDLLEREGVSGLRDIAARRLNRR